MGQALAAAWAEFGGRLAVLAGMCVALGSLMQHCPVWVASVRGGFTTIAIALIVHWVARLLVWSSAGDRAEARARAAALPASPIGASATKPGGPRG